MEIFLQILVLSHALFVFLIINESNIENPQEAASLKMELSDLQRTLWGQLPRHDLCSEMWGTPCVDFSSSLAWD